MDFMLVEGWDITFIEITGKSWQSGKNGRQFYSAVEFISPVFLGLIFTK